MPVVRKVAKRNTGPMPAARAAQPAVRTNQTAVKSAAQPPVRMSLAAVPAGQQCQQVRVLSRGEGAEPVVRVASPVPVPTPPKRMFPECTWTKRAL
ncbi:hypothetical protein KIPB_014139 [Kipferlia bialata]|uniref:Uncharacterized protein n=1 Tax=Kipferlia bialata TaxID=797122 RepID=A0A9K3D9F7_9EUKA|nr:hypothetical protein KIPB_014139 [Kipferlia bialata]|eukprot:g14139.t1